jgi:hypothetical protein
MHRVVQTRFGNPGGNCHQAALASLLELPLEAVPDFVNDYHFWDTEQNKWLYNMGLFCVHVRSGEDDGSELEWLTDNVPCIISVKSLATQGALHSVIYHKGHVVHDPHPSQVHRWREVEIVGYDVIAAVDPARAARSCETCIAGPTCVAGLEREKGVCDDGDFGNEPEDKWLPKEA